MIWNTPGKFPAVTDPGQPNLYSQGVVTTVDPIPSTIVGPMVSFPWKLNSAQTCDSKLADALMDDVVDVMTPDEMHQELVIPGFISKERLDYLLRYLDGCRKNPNSSERGGNYWVPRRAMG